MTQRTTNLSVLTLILALLAFTRPISAQPTWALGDHHAYMPMTQSAAEEQETYVPENRAFELEVLRLINVERAANDLPALIENASLTQAARRHSQDMANNEFFSHTGSDNSTPVMRMRQEGYTGAPRSEVVAAGQRTPSQVVDAWMNSDTHRPILLSDELNEFGVGFATNAEWVYDLAWTVTFGRR